MIEAIFYLGYCYLNGIGTEINKDKEFGKKVSDTQNFLNENDDKMDDIDKVNYWYHKSADKYNKEALYKLGEFYEAGKGIRRDLVGSFDFIKINRSMMIRSST